MQPHTMPHGGSTGDLMYLFMVFGTESQIDRLTSRVLYLRLERKRKEKRHEQKCSESNLGSSTRMLMFC